MEKTVIKTENLTKFYGKNRGVIDINIEVKSGEVFGYLGPNGAGKTTTIRTLLDLIRPTKGQAEIFGLDIKRYSTKIRGRIGYIPGELALYDKLTGKEFLQYFSNLQKNVDWRFVEELAERLASDLSIPVRSYSSGNKQKIGLIQAFMHKPELLILDEPTRGLDPLIQQEFYQLIKEVKREGRTVFLSSHIMPEVERVCDRVGIIREGKLVAVEHIADLKSRALRQLEIYFAKPVPKEAFADLSGVKDVKVENSVLHCTVVGSLDPVIKAAANYEVLNVISREPNLEEIFLTYYKEGEIFVA